MLDFETALKEIKEGENFVVNAIRSMSEEEARQLLQNIVNEFYQGIKWFGKKRTFSGRDRPEELADVCDLDLLLNYHKVVMNVTRNTKFTNDPDIRPPVLPCGSSPDTGTIPRSEVSFMLVGSGSTDRINSYVSAFSDGIVSPAKHTDKEWLLDFFLRHATGCFEVRGDEDVTTTNEAETRDAFVQFVATPVIQYLSSKNPNLIRAVTSASHTTESTSRRVSADITINNGSEVLTFIEMKRAGLHIYGNEKGSMKLESDSEHINLHSVMHQAAKYLLVYGVCICIVSDYKTSYVIELAFDDPQWQNSSRTSIPIRSYAIDIKYGGEDSHLPIQMVLAAIIWHQCHLTEDEIAWNKLSLGWLGVLLRGDAGTVGPEADTGVSVPDPGTQEHLVVGSSSSSSAPSSSSRSDSSSAFRLDPNYSTSSSSSGSAPRGPVPRRSAPRSAPNPYRSSDPNPDPNPDPNADSNGRNPSTSPSSTGEESNIVSYKPAYKEHRGITQEFDISEDGISHNEVHFSAYESFSGFRILQMNIESPAIVLCTTQENLRKYFPTISLHPYEPQRKVVIKIFDYCHMNDCLEDRKFTTNGRWTTSYDVFVRSQHKKVMQEIRCYEKIGEYNRGAKESERINVPLLYDYGNLHLKHKDGKTHYEGFFLLLDYAGEEVSCIDKDQFEDGARNLHQMGNLGIEYLDLNVANVRLKDGKLFFIDFNSCELKESPVGNGRAIRELKQIQYEMSYMNKN